MNNFQTGKGDFTTLHNGKIYKFPTEGELWEFIREEAQEKNDLDNIVLVGVQPQNRERIHPRL